MVYLAVSWGLPLYTPLHPPLPIRLSLVHSSRISLYYSAFALTGDHCYPSVAAWLPSCMSSVMCLNGLILRGMCVGVKPVKWCPSQPPLLLHLFVLVAACPAKAPVCLLRDQQALSGLLGAVRVKSLHQRSLAVIYSHWGLNPYLSPCCTRAPCECQPPSSARLYLFQSLNEWLVNFMWENEWKKRTFTSTHLASRRRLLFFIQGWIFIYKWMHVKRLKIF